MKYIKQVVTLNNIAIFFLVIGIAIASRHFINYAKIDYSLDKEKNKADVELALTGLFFTIASTLFVIVNLKKQGETIKLQSDSLIIQSDELVLQRKELSLQRAEMEQANQTALSQQEAISLQQAESTFFNLLKHHKEIIGSTTLLEPDEHGILWHSYAMPNLIEYYEAIKERYFKPIHKTSWSPNKIFESNNEIAIVCDSINLIVELIQETLKDKLFYHKILASNLTDCERFIYGLGIEIGKYKRISSTFEYEQFYFKVCLNNRHSQANYCPAVEIPFYKEQINLVTFDELKSKHEKFKFIINDEFNSNDLQVEFDTITTIPGSQFIAENIQHKDNIYTNYSILMK